MNAVYAANVHFGRCFDGEVIANANKPMCGIQDLFSPLSLALTTGTCELLNWKLLYGIAGVFFCANKLLCVSVCVHMRVYFGFLAKLTLTNCSCVFIMPTVVVTPSAAGTQIQ